MKYLKRLSVVSSCVYICYNEIRVFNLFVRKEKARAEMEAAESARIAKLHERALSEGAAEKDLGNLAMQKKDLKAALQHYTRAIQVVLGDEYNAGVLLIEFYSFLISNLVSISLHRSS